MTPRLRACIWPSRPARDQALGREARRAPGGFLFTPPWYTLEELLPLVLDQVELPFGWEPLDELAGPLLVQGLIQDEQEELAVYHGMARGRHLPDRLWRLLVELKAAGIRTRDLEALARQGGRRLRALARILGRYEQALRDLRLADQADRLGRFEAMLARGKRPPLLNNWAAVQARQVLWLRPLDLRLFRALARVLPLEVNFLLAPEGGGFASLHRLARYTEQVLMREDNQAIELRWLDPAEGSGALAGFVGTWMRGEPASPPGPGELELFRSPGRYVEVEEMVCRALQLCEGGVAPHQVALVFPNLAIYDQMALNAARRLGLPLRPAQGRSLLSEPLVRDFLALLELPLVGYARVELAGVLESPYLSGPLGRVFGESGRALSPGLGRVLGRLGYVDGREEGPGEFLERRAGGDSEGAELSLVLKNLRVRLEKIVQHNNLNDYISDVVSLAQELGLDRPYPEATADPHLAARDLGAAHAMLYELEDLARTASQLRQAPRPALTPARLAALVRQTLAGAQTRSDQGVPGGVHLLRLDQTLGLELHTVLVGGLDQGRFPRRPPGRHLVSGQDRLALGKLAGMPVWRTEEEDYGGQLMRLMRLLASVRAGAVLSHAAADQEGREQEPSLVFQELDEILDSGRRRPGRGGIFGQAPPLERCQDPQSLWTRLAELVLGAGDEDHPLARAALHHLLRRPGAREQWDDLAARVEMERQRRQGSGPFCGHLDSGPARELLSRALEGRRRLSPSSLESYAACPLAWFFSSILGLQRDAEPGWDVERSLEGQWVHRTLALFFHPKHFDPGLDQPGRQKRLQRCLGRAGHELFEHSPGGHRLVWQARRRFLEKVLATVVETECEEMGGGRPLAVEMRLGPQGKGIDIALEDGRSITIVGRLDRLDQCGSSLVVTDYKHSDNESLLRNAVKQELFGESAFQVPIYLAAVVQNLGPDQADSCQGRVVSTRRPAHKPRLVRFEPDDPYLASDPHVRSCLDLEDQPNIFNQVVRLWQDMSGGYFPPRPEGGACSYCDFIDPCREAREAGP